ncbi:hypothetical protein TNCV_4516381 [Trichonephila clavipes]|uniref:Uncharacterized protein n=1 Tax=Trichonephila clavipes TaxID=2585209 RepID=A0A8X6VBF8_TRICX|nr:hypothetical protein TNCV_4516381 [Trichonephila clavipes]
MIFLRNHKNCLRKRTSGKMQTSHHRRRDCRHIKYPGISQISPATTEILSTRDRRRRRGLRKQNSSHDPTGGRGGQESVPANLPDHSVLFFHRPGYAVSNALRTSDLKYVGSPSC